MGFNWVVCSGRVECFLDEYKVFSDSCDHWRNAICRLLGVDDKTARAWVEVCCQDREFKSAYEALIRSTRYFFDCGKFPEQYGKDKLIYSELIDGFEEFQIIGSIHPRHASLLKKGTLELADPPAYDEDYFEHGTSSGVGYGDLLAQSDWRLEKSTRYFLKIIEILKKNELDLKGSAQVLDIGSGYGFMRLPYEKNGFATYGVEVSSHAAEVAKSKFGLDTFIGEISKLPDVEAYDLMLAYDIIEHVKAPDEFIAKCVSILNPGGFLVLRTPNLLSIEAAAFGDKFHSFKREHLHYFSIESLSMLLMTHSLKIVNFSTLSHLFTGFMNIDCGSLEKSGLGSDIFCIAQKRPHEF
jgi:2-polyprenyl-3-methyl-5-hydroxy-6-metoxy-1,4-benzoquinol methylase